MSDNTQQEPLWNDEKIDDHVRYHSYMGMSEYQMADRAFNGAGASVIETHYVKIFMRKMRGEYEDKVAELEAALAARDERIKALEARADPNALSIAYGQGYADAQERYRPERDQLRQQLNEAQPWMPIADNDVTRGFAAMLAFDGLRDYADCRVCRQADAATTNPNEEQR